MAAEYLAQDQSVALNSPILFSASIPCNKGYVYFENGNGVFTLRGIVNNPCANFAQYKVTFVGNIAITEGGAVSPIAVAFVVNGAQRIATRAIYTPAAALDFGNVTATTIVKVPKGCCFNLAVDYVSGVVDDPTTTPTPIIDVVNGNLTISRIA